MLMRTLEITAAEFGLLAASYKIASGVIGLFYSSIGDIFNRKGLTLFTLFLFVLSTLFCAVAPNYETLLFARVLAGLCGGILTPSIYAIVSDLIPFERRGKALGMIMASFSVSSTVGIPLGLIIAESFGWRSTFHFIGACTTLVLLANMILLPSVPIKNVKRFKLKGQFRDLFKGLTQADNLSPFIVMMCFTFSGFMLFPYLSPYATKNIGLAESDLKYIYLVGGFFTVIVQKLNRFSYFKNCPQWYINF